ncbi:hypothetical protein MTY81_63480 (plasmid) [Mycolicibacterium sp. TY81]|nr:hypothetical protein MTY81_63480 [Mycolicibacterium sp. TY81]
MREIYNAEDIDHAQVAIKAFEVDYGAKYPKAVAKIVDDADVLLEFYKYPAEHWVHLRTTNPIESTFATVRLRTKVTKGAGFTRRRNGHGLQADRRRASPLASRQRTAPGRSGPGRRDLPQRQTARATHRHHPVGGLGTDRINWNGGRLKQADPQVLTIPRLDRGRPRSGVGLDGDHPTVEDNRPARGREVKVRWVC